VQLRPREIMTSSSIEKFAKIAEAYGEVQEIALAGDGSAMVVFAKAKQAMQCVAERRDASWVAPPRVVIEKAGVSISTGEGSGEKTGVAGKEFKNDRTMGNIMRFNPKPAQDRMDFVMVGTDSDMECGGSSKGGSEKMSAKSTHAKMELDTAKDSDNEADYKDDILATQSLASDTSQSQQDLLDIAPIHNADWDQLGRI
jgi:hypothetical protein